MAGRIAPPLFLVPLFLAIMLVVAGCAATGNASGKRNIVGPVFFTCDDGTRLTVRFDRDDDTARVIGTRGLSVILPRGRAASGYAYEDAAFSLRGKGRDAFWEAPGRAPTRCRERTSQ